MISKESYIEECYRSAFQYEKDIQSGKIKASRWIKKAIERRKKIHKKFFFNEEAVRKVFSFFYYVNITIGGKPVQFKPLPWQAWVTLNMYGYFRDKLFKKRLFRYINIWVSRKSAKTTLSAIFALYALMKEERNAEVYFAATTKDQASQALRYLKQIVQDSPALAKRVLRQQYRLLYKHNGECIAKPVANEPDKLDGLSPSFSIIDEKHALPTNDLFNIMKTGTLARENPQIVSISTSGFNKDYPYFMELEIGKRVLNEEIEDDATFYAFYTLDDESEVDDFDMWEKANPSLKEKHNEGEGVISLEDLIIDYKKACLTITDKKNFLTKNLNLYVDGEDTWIPDEDYRKVFNSVDIQKLKGCKAYIGIDLSTSTDLSSLVVVVEHPETKKIQVIPEFYFPSSREEKKIRASGIDLTEWIEKGFILEHEGKIIDYDKVFERIKFYCDYFDIQAIAYDPWNSLLLISKIEEEIMVDLVPCRQNTGFFNFPLKYIERLVYSQQIDISQSPVLRWNFRNVVLYYDGNGNIKIVKNKSLDSVDGAVALAMAVGMYCEMNFDAIKALMEDINKESNEV